MLTRIRKAITRLRREDRGSMTQVLLVSMMIPALVALMVSTALTQLFLQVEDGRRTNMVSATEEAGAYLLNDINTKLPSRFLDMSAGDLASATTHTIESLNAKTYVSNFTVGTNGWIQAIFTVDLLDSPGQPGSYSVQYRPTKATVFKGFDNTTGRPLWAFTDIANNPNASLEPLGLFEQVPVVSNENDYPTINIPGVKASAPQNLRILRSAQFGIALAWDKPMNATDAKLGNPAYRIDSTKNNACFNKSPDSGKEVLAAGYVVLSDNKDSTDWKSWNCSSSDISNLVSVRGLGEAGPGVAAFVNLSTLPTYDLDNLVPTAPANVVYTKTGNSDVITWDEQTCNFGYNIEFRITKTTQNAAVGNYGVVKDWSSYIASGGKFSYTLPSSGVLQGSKQGWVVDARCLSSTFGASSASARSNEPIVTPPIVATVALSNVNISGNISGTGSFTTVGVCSPGVVTGLTPQYRVAYTKKNNAASTVQIRDWSTSTASFAVSSNLGTYAAVSVESRCGSANNPAIYGTVTKSTSSDWLAGIPAPGGTLTVSHNAGNQATFGGSTCTVGVVQYYLQQTASSANSQYNKVWMDWGTQTVVNVGVTIGSSQTIQVKSRCMIDGNSSTESAFVSHSWTIPVAAPVGTVPGVRNDGWGNVQWNSFTGCSAGTTPQYRVLTNKLNGNVTSTYSAWTGGLVYVIGAYQGYPQAAQVQVKCVYNGSDSANSALSGQTAWTAGLAAPAAPTIYSVTGNYDNAYWYAIGCPTGSSVSYYIAVDFDSTRLGDSGWTGATGWTRPRTNLRATWIYWHTISACATPYARAQSGVNTLRQ